MYDSSNMFEVATRKKIRITTPKGLISVEDLWEVPLRSKDAYNLEEIAKLANRALASVSEESFVPKANKTKDPKKDAAQLNFDIVKHVIDVKFEEEERTKHAAAKRAEKAKLLDALAEKEDAELKGLSKTELLKRINKIDANEEE